MENNNGISAIILAGGKSRRLGEDKRAIKLNNKSLFEYSLALAGEVTDDILISANDYLPCFEQYNIIPDIIEGAGPLQGIISSLHQIKYKQSLLLTSDMPFLSLQIISNLIKAAKKDSITHYTTSGQFLPFPSVFPSSILQKIIALEKSGMNSMKQIFRNIPAIEIHIPDQTYKYAFLNVNRPKEYSMAEKLLHELPDLRRKS